jgi:5-methylthioadenosine/S-adenosylhomocysteine deaminase
MEREIGSVEAGKKADLALLDLDRVESPYAADRAGVYGSIIYTGSAENVVSTMIDGRWVYRNRRHLTLDLQETAARARGELRGLLSRLQ